MGDISGYFRASIFVLFLFLTSSHVSLALPRPAQCSVREDEMILHVIGPQAGDVFDVFFMC